MRGFLTKGTREKTASSDVSRSKSDEARKSCGALHNEDVFTGYASDIESDSESVDKEESNGVGSDSDDNDHEGELSHHFVLCVQVLMNETQ